ncbi:unnamed protein product [Parajaminaea phylloscopi]
MPGLLSIPATEETNQDGATKDNNEGQGQASTEATGSHTPTPGHTRRRLQRLQAGLPPRPSRLERLAEAGASDGTDDSTLSHHSSESSSGEEEVEHGEQGPPTVSTRWADMTEEDLALQAAGQSPGLPTPPLPSSPILETTEEISSAKGDVRLGWDDELPQDARPALTQSTQAPRHAGGTRRPQSNGYLFPDPWPLYNRKSTDQRPLRRSDVLDANSLFRRDGAPSHAHALHGYPARTPRRHDRDNIGANNIGSRSGWGNYSKLSPPSQEAPWIIRERLITQQRPLQDRHQRRDQGWPLPSPHLSPFSGKPVQGPATGLNSRARWGFAATGLASAIGLPRTNGKLDSWSDSEEPKAEAAVPRLAESLGPNQSPAGSMVRQQPSEDATTPRHDAPPVGNTTASLGGGGLVSAPGAHSTEAAVSAAAENGKGASPQPTDLHVPSAPSPPPVRCLRSQATPSTIENLRIVIGSVVVTSDSVKDPSSPVRILAEENSGLPPNATSQRSKPLQERHEKCVSTSTLNSTEDATSTILPAAAPIAPPLTMVPLPPGFVVDIHQFVYDLRGVIPVLIGPWALPAVQSLLQGALLQSVPRVYSSFGHPDEGYHPMGSFESADPPSMVEPRPETQLPKTAATAAAFTPGAIVATADSSLTATGGPSGAHITTTSEPAVAESWFSPLVTPYPRSVTHEEGRLHDQSTSTALELVSPTADIDVRTDGRGSYTKHRFGHPSRPQRPRAASKSMIHLTKRRWQPGSTGAPGQEISSETIGDRRRSGEANANSIGYASHGFSPRLDRKGLHQHQTSPPPLRAGPQEGTFSPAAHLHHHHHQQQQQQQQHISLDAFGQSSLVPMHSFVHTSPAWSAYSGPSPLRPFEHSSIPMPHYWSMGPPAFSDTPLVGGHPFSPPMANQPHWFPTPGLLAPQSDLGPSSFPTPLSPPFALATQH